jgi:hypothetical protein
VAASAYGVSRLATGHLTARGITILVIGLIAAALVAVTVIRRHRGRRPSALLPSQTGRLTILGDHPEPS